MTKEITITVTAPVECTDEQFAEWIKFLVGYTCEMSMSNPLQEYDMETERIEIKP